MPFSDLLTGTVLAMLIAAAPQEPVQAPASVTAVLQSMLPRHEAVTVDRLTEDCAAILRGMHDPSSQALQLQACRNAAREIGDGN